MQTLEALASQIPSPPSKVAEVDISAYMPGVTIVWEEPSVAKTYMIATDAETLIKRYPQWSEVPFLAIHVAAFAAAHVAPATGKLAPGLFYAMIADKNRDLHFFLKEEYERHFPGIISAPLEKKASSDSASATYDATLLN